jgi:PIN domain nuclease of toxin-antitoxin system
MLNLDTHLVVFALGGNLKPREKALLSENNWGISAIVLWELAKLVQLGRIALEFDDVEIVRVLHQLQVWPIDLAVARTSKQLDFEGDPADELIAATSVVHNVPLLTRDRAIRRSRMVPLAIR